MGQGSPWPCETLLLSFLSQDNLKPLSSPLEGVDLSTIHPLTLSQHLSFSWSQKAFLVVT